MAEENFTKLSKKDKKWQSFNRKLQKQVQDNDFWGLSATYYEMAAFLEEQGSEFEHLRQKGFEMKQEAARQYAKQNLQNVYVTKLETYANNDSCEECKKRSGTLVLLQEAIENPPIPVKECTSKPYGCKCTFLPRYD